MPLGRSATGLQPCQGTTEPLQVRALALAAGDALWVLVWLDASLVDAPTATAIGAGLGSLGGYATVVASTNRAAPPLTACAEGGAFRDSVASLASAVAWAAVARREPAKVVSGAGELEYGGEVAELYPSLPYVDVLHISPTRERPRVVLANAAVPRLVDTFRGVSEPGVWAASERALATLTGEPTVVLGLNASPAQEPAAAQQRTGQGRRVAAALVPALARALGGVEERVPCRLRTATGHCPLPTMPLADRYDVRQAADRAEFGCQDGTPAQRFEATARWQWLERVYQASMNGRIGEVLAPVSRIQIGDLALLAVGVDCSEAAAVTLADRAEGELTWVVSGAGGRTGAALLTPDPPSLTRLREGEPLTDLWPLYAGAVGDLAAQVRDLAPAA